MTGVRGHYAFEMRLQRVRSSNVHFARTVQWCTLKCAYAYPSLEQ